MHPRILLSVVLLSLLSGCLYRPPGNSYRGALPDATDRQRDTARELERIVTRLAGRIGPRCLTERYPALMQAERWIEHELQTMGYDIDRQAYKVGSREAANLAIERSGNERRSEFIVMAAHYDTVCWSPGANDNTSGVAALLCLAQRLRTHAPDRTLRLVFLTNEEQPYAWTPRMGSYVYARRCSERGENVVGMISLDEIGYYDGRRGSQKYIFPLSLLYPSKGDFLTIVTNAKNRRLMNEVAAAFRRHVPFPSEGLAVDVRDVGRSDHWGFWQFGYPGLMITDTANFRYPHYHRPTDTPDRIDYDRLSRVVDGLEGVLLELGTPGHERPLR